MQPHKICPRCHQPAAVNAALCMSCGHQYRTKFDQTSPALIAKKDLSLILGVIFVLVLLAALVLPFAMPKPRNFAQDIRLLDARLVDSHDANGKSVQRLLLRWQNESPVPIVEVRADLHFYDKEGSLMEDSIDDRFVFCAENESEIVPLGGVHEDADGHGILLVSTYVPSAERAVSVQVRVTYASDKETDL